MLISALMTAVALLGSDPDGVVATAPVTPDLLVAARAPAEAPGAPSVEGAAQQAAPHGLGTDEQIDRWIAARAPGTTTFAAGGPQPEVERRLHGEFSVAVGTDGYRDYGVAISAPLGESGWVDLSYREVRNGQRHYGYGYDNPYFDDSGYAFPGAPRADAAYEFESRAMRPDGPPRRTMRIEERRWAE
jgi:hypothetical protein